MEYAGIGGLIVLVLDVWAIFAILTSAAPTANKVLWILLVLILPVIGFILWLIAGPRGAT